MPVLHAAQRKALPASEFAVPGKRKLPMHDRTHAELARKMINRAEGLTEEDRREAERRLNEKLSGYESKDTISMPRKAFEAEHKNLLKVLKSPDHKDDLAEAKKQQKEVDETHTTPAASIVSNNGGNAYMSCGLLPKDPSLDQLSAAISFVDDLNPIDAYDLLSDVEGCVTTMLLSSFEHLKGPAVVNCYFSNTVSDQSWMLSESGKKVKIPVARMGTFVHPVYGIVTFGQRDFDKMKENFANDECGFKPYLRYGHARHPAAVDGEPAIAYLEKLEQEDEVLWGVYDPLDDKLVDEIEKGAYVNASAELKRYAMSKRDGRAIGTLLTAHALTNAPFVPGMPNNQVLSAQGADDGSVATDSCTLNMSEGENPMPHGNANEALSDLLAQVETLSISADEREKIRKSLAKLAGTAAQPGYDSNKEAGKQSSTYAKEKLSGEGSEAGEGEDLSAGSQAVDKPAGKQSGTYAKEKLSGDGDEKSHGAPFAKAAEALEEAAKSEDAEEHSDSTMFGEVLSAMANFFMKKKGAKPSEKPAGNPFAKADEKHSGSTTTMLPAPGANGKLNLSDTPDEGDDHMNEAQIKALLDEHAAGLKQEFSTQLAAKDEKIQSLEVKLTETAEQAQKFSTYQATSAFDARINGLVAAGIPAAMV